MEENAKKSKTIILAGSTIKIAAIPVEKVHQANARIASHMKQVSREYRAKAAISKNEMAKKVLNF